MITLHPKHPFKAPVDAECISPDVFAEKSAKEIAALQIWEGNRKRTLSGLFKIKHENDSSSKEFTIRICGDVSKVRKIGAKMSKGNIIVEGDAGMHLGEEMKGGVITVTGNADSWTGSMMKEGTIEIKGNVGDYIGASYRGSTQGMSGGKIIIHGDAGYEVGCFMRKGLIKVHGNIGKFAGIHMRNGTIFIQGNSEGRAGAQMISGKIVVCGHIPSILPTFTIDNVRPKVKVNGEKVEGPFYRFIGDLADGGNGKLFVSKTKNTHLNSYEEYL
ncbi:MAG: formylmethanofuran dehydrogenase subunit C [Candidatus Bathyarchaeota archaeon]|nr:MAG: formylmethanofuran dehydrogenase subunit C [Candidatus Bathyarchaeota archaeon]